MGVFNCYHAVQDTPGRLPGLAVGAKYGAGSNDSPHWATALSYTHIFNPTLTNSVHFGYQSTTNHNVLRLAISPAFQINMESRAFNLLQVSVDCHLSN
jgi:hypothetical protein